jgi:hypothetical protein
VLVLPAQKFENTHVSCGSLLTHNNTVSNAHAQANVAIFSDAANGIQR